MVEWKQTFWVMTPKENMPYTCIACITIDSIIKIDKKNLSASLFRRMQV